MLVRAERWEPSLRIGSDGRAANGCAAAWVEANALAPVVQRSPDEATATAWIDFAQHVTARRLISAVDAALSLGGEAGPPPLARPLYPVALSSTLRRNPRASRSASRLRSSGLPFSESIR